MGTRRKIFEDDRRIFYTSPTTGLLIQSFKDHSGEAGSGALDSRISGHLMTCLNRAGIGTHFVRQINMREWLVQETGILPISIVSHTVISESLAARFQAQEGIPLARPLLEFYYHTHPTDNRERPILVGEDHIRGFSWISDDDLQDIISCALRAHDFFSGFFMSIGLFLHDLHLRFGRFFDPATEASRILLIDGPLLEEVSLKDIKTGAPVSTLSLYREGCLSLEQKKIIGEKMGILETKETPEKRKTSWLGLFRKEPREG
jgi:phosphoribosylaminoimidazole-succinocarboxamide synthase